MANSVSRINVVVGANTSQLSAGMRQAAATVSGGMSRVQQVSQAATFAVDDFFAAFSTGGVAGGLRGAGNNLTQIASMLGGIKTQLAVIGVLAVGQFIAKQWDSAAKSVEHTSRELTKLQDVMKRNSALATSGASSQRSLLRDIAGETSVSGIQDRRRAGMTALADLQADLENESSRIANLRQLKASVIGDDATKAVQDELDERQKNANKIRDEIRAQKELNKAMDERLQTLRRGQRQGPVAPPALGLNLTAKERERFSRQIADIDSDAARLRESMRPSLSMADMFRLLPGANAMGSSGAIGAINAAIAGSQNARDAGPALMRSMDGTLKRIEDLEKKKKGLVEVIGL